MKVRRIAPAAALAAAALALAGCGSTPADPATADERGHAKVMCEQFVDARLKAPATADYDLQTPVKDAATYTVTGHVDAENGFGAQVRADIRCVVRSDGDGHWTLVDLDMDTRR